MKIQDIKFEIEQLTNTDLYDLLQFILLEIELSETCIKEGFELRK
jgi:hypothetical protein